MNAFTQIIGAALVQSLWQDALLAALLWMALRALHRRSPNVRYVIACVVLALMVLWPVFSSIALVHPQAGTSRAIDTESSALAPLAVASTIVRFTISVAPSLASDALFPRWIVPLWFVGVLLCSLRAIGSAAHVVVIARRSEPAGSDIVNVVSGLARRAGISRAVRVVLSAVTQGPATVGAIRPIILIPAAAVTGLTPQQL